jgi:hypothetical protein
MLERRKLVYGEKSKHVLASGPDAVTIGYGVLSVSADAT